MWEDEYKRVFYDGVNILPWTFIQGLTKLWFKKSVLGKFNNFIALIFSQIRLFQIDLD